MSTPQSGSGVAALRPTTEEVRSWLVSTVRHVCMVEYYLDRFDAGHLDPQRPHDVVGKGNKFSWPVLTGLAIQYRSKDYSPQEKEAFFKAHVLPSIEYHRQQQYHHQMWNFPNPKATDDDLFVGALDALCSLLDNRPYQGGAHAFEQLPEIISQEEKPRQKGWLEKAYLRMAAASFPQPAVQLITGVQNFPNVGLPQKVYDIICQKTGQALAHLRGEKGYLGL